MSDTDLIRYLDGELDTTQRTRLEATLAHEPASAERLTLLRRRASRLGAMLRSVDPADSETRRSAAAMAADVTPARPMPRQWSGAFRWRMPPVLGAAAVVALVALGILLVEPARAWIAERLRDIAGVERAPASGVPADDSDSDVAARAQVRVTFAWSRTTFDVAADGVAGVLVVTRGVADSAAAEASRAADAGVLVTPHGIRILGAGSADAVFNLVLPPAVTTLRRVYDDGTVESHRLPADGTGLTIRLQPDRAE